MSSLPRTAEGEACHRRVVHAASIWAKCTLVSPSSEAGHRVVTSNAGKNRNQVSKLRLIIPGEEMVEVRVQHGRRRLEE